MRKDILCAVGFRSSLILVNIFDDLIDTDFKPIGMHG